MTRLYFKLFYAYSGIINVSHSTLLQDYSLESLPTWAKKIVYHFKKDSLLLSVGMVKTSLFDFGKYCFCFSQYYFNVFLELLPAITLHVISTIYLNCSIEHRSCLFSS